MTETTIRELTRLRDTTADDFERRLFTSLLAMDAAASVTAEESEPEELVRCAQCDDAWPASDLYVLWPVNDPYGAGICPSCIIGNYYEARRRRLEGERGANPPRDTSRGGH